MKKAKCTAIAEYGRINLAIKKEEQGYEEFVKVLNKIRQNGVSVWYGDVTDENGNETTGLIVTDRNITQFTKLKKQIKRLLTKK